jgi:hypothetical protein
MANPTPLISTSRAFRHITICSDAMVDDFPTHHLHRLKHLGLSPFTTMYDTHDNAEGFGRFVCLVVPGSREQCNAPVRPA